MADIAKDGGTAFPGVVDYWPTSGMSLKDWFAGQALMGSHEFKNPDDAARWCYKLADAMLRERARNEG